MVSGGPDQDAVTEKDTKFPPRETCTREGGVMQWSEFHTIAPSQGERAAMSLGSEDAQESKDFAHCDRELKHSMVAEAPL